MKNAKFGEQKANRQCWECLKRRLVCDQTLPHCKKCQKTGKDCPGYDEQKPLQWIETGKVCSRRRKKDGPSKIYTARPKTSRPAIEEVQSLPVVNATATSVSTPAEDRQATFEDLVGRAIDYELLVKSWKSSNRELWHYLGEDCDETIIAEFALQFVSGSDRLDRLFADGTRSVIEEVVAQKDHKRATELLRTKRKPLKRLEYILKIIQQYDVPNYPHLDETHEVVQAVNYYNARMHPTISSAKALAPNPVLVTFPLNALHVLPPAIHHTLVCLAVNHYIHTLPVGADKSVAIENRSKIYHHRGAAIRALSQYVGKDKTRCNDLTIASILMFMSMELQNPSMTDWRSHANGIQKLIKMRGGLKTLVKQSPYLVPTLVIYILIVTVANACSPSWDQIEISGTIEENIEDVTALYSIMFPFTLCPPELFLAVMRINHLRNKVSASMFVSGDVDASRCLEAHDLLSNIEAFVPEDWAQPGDRYEEWLMIGTIWQTTVALYCTMAFQSLAVLPNSLEMNSMRTIHSDRLLENLKSALRNPRLRNFVQWPLTVAGVEAGYRDQATRYWIETQYSYLSRLLGSSGPLKGQAVMKRYWQKNEPGWDACFDRPYVFVI